LFNYGLKVT